MSHIQLKIVCRLYNAIRSRISLITFILGVGCMRQILRTWEFHWQRVWNCLVCLFVEHLHTFHSNHTAKRYKRTRSILLYCCLGNMWFYLCSDQFWWVLKYICIPFDFVETKKSPNVDPTQCKVKTSHNVNKVSQNKHVNDSILTKCH